MTIRKLSIIILHHPARRHLISYLQEKLGFVIVCEDSQDNLLKNSREAWLMNLQLGCEYGLVLDDDVIIGKDFYSNVDKLLNDKNMAYSLYWGEYPVLPSEVRAGYKILNIVRWGCGIVLPTHLISEMLDYTSTIKNLPETKAFDTRISKFIEYKKIKCKYPIPCLIDHRASELSLAGNKGLNRHSKYFTGE